ncbi:MAG: iron ABC transporter permease [Desulfurococcaceae archaeon]
MIFLTTLIALLIVTSYISIYHGTNNPLIINYRLTRVLSVILSGLVIGFNASYLQSCLRNPLVDHYILGVGSGAVFSTYLAFIILSTNIFLLTSVFAVAGGLLALVITITVSEYLGGSDYAYILVGIGVNSLFSGLTILFSQIAMRKLTIPHPMLMLIGSFINASSKNIPYLLATLIATIISYPLLSKPLNTIILGDYYSKQLGYNPRIARFTTIVLAGTTTSIVVSIHGTIGFVGLVSPHLSRLSMKTADQRFVAPSSALLSSILLLLTDTMSRTILAKSIGEIPAGAIVSIIGAPLFIYMLISRFRK